ncbi:hypothetical protein BRADI_2g07263v3 [Brachypodium distachyon]|uniref:Uncharacterized protein n=1 Tax=Brachypodium distachyon TaxID=15368 RepID=A0A0Q3FVB8_BRADI|nr:hypothetical protein BRADI_2g07263v3 [Brachypodium distachyon]
MLGLEVAWSSAASEPNMKMMDCKIFTGPTVYRHVRKRWYRICCYLY